MNAEVYLCQAALRSCLLRTPRHHFIPLAHLAPATVPPRQPCSTRCRFVGLANPHTTRRSSPTQLASTTLLSRDLAWCSHLDARLGFPAEHSASRVRGDAVMAQMARLVEEGMWRLCWL